MLFILVTSKTMVLAIGNSDISLPDKSTILLGLTKIFSLIISSNSSGTPEPSLPRTKKKQEHIHRTFLFHELSANKEAIASYMLQL